MGLSKETISNLENQSKKISSDLAHEAQIKLCNKYLSLINDYYFDYDPKMYVRTHNLYRSFKKYYKNSHSTIYYGGVEVTTEKMFENYRISKDVILFGYVYRNPESNTDSGTYHGRIDIPAKFSIYEEMQKYKKELISYYSSYS